MPLETGTQRFGGQDIGIQKAARACLGDARHGADIGL